MDYSFIIRICIIDVTLLASDEMTLLSCVNEPLIFFASFKRVPDDPVSPTLSDPARSMRFSDAANHHMIRRQT